MRDEYDFPTGKRGAIAPSKGKTRITLYLDNEVLETFRERAENAGIGYQTLINETLKSHIKDSSEQPLTESALRRVLREELTSSKG
jgi:uncharacterized protein (DUF4415 family)